MKSSNWGVLTKVASSSDCISELCNVTIILDEVPMYFVQDGTHKFYRYQPYLLMLIYMLIIILITTEKRKSKSYTIESVLKAESDARTTGKKVIGVALSGGGIRSASFSCGVLNGLQKMRLLQSVNFLSCVSGGGYTGTSFLTHAIKEKDLVNNGTYDNFDYGRVLKKMKERMRTNVNYFKRDCGIPTAIISFIIGSLLNLVILLWLSFIVGHVTDHFCGCPNNEPCTGSFLCPGLSNDISDFQSAFWSGYPFLLTIIATAMGVLFIFFIGCFKMCGCKGWTCKKQNPTSQNSTKSHCYEALLDLLITVWIIVFIWDLANLLAVLLLRYKSQSSTAGLFSSIGIAFTAISQLRLFAINPNLLVTVLLYLSSFIGFGFISLLLGSCIAWRTVAASGDLETYLLCEAILGVSSFFLGLCYEYCKPNHQFYKNQLKKAFYADGVDGKELKLSECAKKTGIPYFIGNTTIHMLGDSKAENFVHTPEYTGCCTAGFIKTRKSANDDLASVMAISGAAISAHPGPRYSKGMGATLLMCLLNFDWGNWMWSQKKRRPQQLMWLAYFSCFFLLPIFFSVAPTMSSILGWTQNSFHYWNSSIVVVMGCSILFGSFLDVLLYHPFVRHWRLFLHTWSGRNAPFYYLTDGGHLENLGLIELLRRDCDLIIVSDAGEDSTRVLSCKSFLNKNIDLWI